MACRTSTGGELSVEGLVGKGERETSQRCSVSTEEQSQFSLLTPHLLFQTQHEAAARTAFPGQLSSSQGHCIQLTMQIEPFHNADMHQ